MIRSMGPSVAGPFGSSRRSHSVTSAPFSEALSLTARGTLFQRGFQRQFRSHDLGLSTWMRRGPGVHGFDQQPAVASLANGIERPRLQRLPLHTNNEEAAAA